MTSPALTPRAVAAAAYLLYGQAWPEKLAAELHVSKRFLQRVAKAARLDEPYDMPEGFVVDLRLLAERKALEHRDRRRGFSEKLEAAARELQQVQA